MTAKKRKILLLISSFCLAIATIGFLLIQFIIEDNIKKRSDDNINLVSSQQMALDWLEKSNFRQELAILLSSQQEILKTLNAPKEVLQKYERHRLNCYRDSVVYTINSVSAANKWSQNESDKILNEINTLTIDQLMNRYLEYMKIAAQGTDELQKKLSGNEKNISNLEYQKKIYWLICFVFQNAGLIIGLILIYLEKQNK